MLTVHVIYSRFGVLLHLELDETEASVGVCHVVFREVDLQTTIRIQKKVTSVGIVAVSLSTRLLL